MVIRYADALVNTYITGAYDSPEDREAAKRRLTTVFSRFPAAGDDAVEADANTTQKIFTDLDFCDEREFISHHVDVLKYLRWASMYCHEDYTGLISSIHHLSYSDCYSHQWFRKSFFLSSNDMLNFFSSKFSGMGGQFDGFICASIFAWHGVTTTAMTEILKKDIQEANYTVQMEYGPLVLSPIEMYFVCKYRSATNYGYISRYDIDPEYKLSKYLFRSNIRDKLGEPNIRYLAYEANKVFEGEKTISFRELRIAGMFAAVYEWEEANKPLSRYTPTFLKQIFPNMPDGYVKSTWRVAIRWYDEYRKFRNFMK